MLFRSNSLRHDSADAGATGPMRAAIAASSPPDPTEVPAVDEEQLDSIQEIVSAKTFIDLIGSFLEGALQRVALAEQQASAGNLTALARTTHDLVSMAGNFGATRVAHLARRIENAARGDDAELVAELMPSLLESADYALGLIRTRLLAVPA